MQEIQKIHAEQATTTIMVTHSMEDVAEYADHLIVMKNGDIVFSGEPRHFFQDEELVNDTGLGIPHITPIAKKLGQQISIKSKDLPITIDEFIDMYRTLPNQSEVIK